MIERCIRCHLPMDRFSLEQHPLICRFCLAAVPAPEPRSGFASFHPAGSITRASRPIYDWHPPQGPVLTPAHAAWLGRQLIRWSEFEDVSAVAIYPDGGVGFRLCIEW